MIEAIKENATVKGVTPESSPKKVDPRNFTPISLSVRQRVEEIIKMGEVSLSKIDRLGIVNSGVDVQLAEEIAQMLLGEAMKLRFFVNSIHYEK